MNTSSSDKPAATQAQTPVKSGPDGDGVQGEGNYTATRRFRESEEQFVTKNRQKIPDMARDAQKALDGAEGDELRQAEDRARSHSHSGPADRQGAGPTGRKI